MTLTAEPTVATARRLALVVTHEHIARGIRGSGLECPVALALNDAGYPGVQVKYARISQPQARGYKAAILVPVEMRQWIFRFDYEGAVHPERFVLDLPADWPEPEFPALVA